MPTRHSRTSDQYEREAEAFVERITREYEDASLLDDEDTWLRHVRQYVLGDENAEFVGAQADFFRLALEQTTEAVSNILEEARFSYETFTTVTGRQFSRFRDRVTGRFTSAATVRNVVRSRFLQL